MPMYRLLQPLALTLLPLMIAPLLLGQPDTRTSYNENQSHRANGYYEEVPPPPQPCFRRERVWKAGHWRFNRRRGRRVWVPGRWVERRVEIPCPTPPPSVVPTRCARPSLPPRAFEEALYSIRSRSFESSRLSVARQVVQNNCLTTDQVRDMLLEFSFESSRLELAKFAYRFTVDPHRYYIVNDAFSFSSSVDELARFIDGCRR